MKILLTGSSGYVGTNLKPYLRSRSHSVTDFDIASDWINDIRNLDRVTLFMSDCEAVIHLAGLSGVDQCESDPKKAVEINVIGTLNVAKTARFNEQKMIFASSFAADDPINIYGLTKRLAEMIVLKHGGIILRLSNVWGGRQYLEKKSSVVAYLMKTKLRGETARIHRDGSQSRDFIHIRDVCTALIKALEVSSGIYKVCTGKQTTILELVKMMDVPFEFIDNPRVMARPGAANLPGWEPTVEFAKQLAKEIKENASTWHPPA